MIQKFNLKKILKNEKFILCAVFVGLGLITFILSHEEEKVQVQAEQAPTIDNFIPEDQALVPIDLINREAISSIVGTTAVVDLLSINPTTMTPQIKIASRVKIIRSPKDHNIFTTLVDDNISMLLATKAGPYFAIVRNRKPTKSDYYKDRKKTKIEINYQE